MSTINLAVRFGHPNAIAHRVRYRRIDLNPNSNYTLVSPNVTASPTVIATDIPNGQYEIESTPIYADNRPCAPIYEYSPSCAGLLSISAYLSLNSIVVQYLAPYEIPQVKINVYYPNGGSFSQIYVNNGVDIVVPLPLGVYGEFAITGQSVCDSDTQFYSPESAQVVVSRPQYNMGVSNFVSGITVVSLTGVSGVTLGSVIPSGSNYRAVHNAFYGPISLTFTGTPPAGQSATLYVNNTAIQCVSVPETDGGVVSFTAASFAAEDVISIVLTAGVCP